MKTWHPEKSSGKCENRPGVIIPQNCNNCKLYFQGLHEVISCMSSCLFQENVNTDQGSHPESSPNTPPTRSPSRSSPNISSSSNTSPSPNRSLRTWKWKCNSCKTINEEETARQLASVARHRESEAGRCVKYSAGRTICFECKNCKEAMYDRTRFCRQCGW